MPFDVEVSAVVRRPPAEVAAFLADPRNDPRWIGGLVEVHPPDGPLEAGSRVARVARFAGRRIHYVLEVERLEPGRLLAMRSVEAPFPMRVAYEVAPEGAASRVTLHVGGGPRGLAALLDPLTAWMVRRNLRADLARLRTAVEG